MVPRKSDHSWIQWTAFPLRSQNWNHVRLSDLRDASLVGGMGPMPPHPVHEITPPAVYGLPHSQGSAASPLTLAIRVWHSPMVSSWWSGGIQGGIRIGSSPEIEDKRASDANRRAWSQTGAIFLGILELLAGLMALAFFVARRDEQMSRNTSGSGPPTKPGVSGRWHRRRPVGSRMNAGDHATGIRLRPPSWPSVRPS